MAYPLEVGIGADWFGIRRRFVSGETGGTLYLIGGYRGNYVVGIDGECTHLSETLSYAVSSEARFVPVLLGQDWLVILEDFLLKWSTIVANAVTSFRKM